MNILLLCEGNAETRDSWSGISKSVVDGLRAAGHQVRTGDVDLYGAPRLLGAGLSFSPRRKRWWARYHLAGAPFALRSRNAAALIAAQPVRPDVILQFGATFEARGRGDVPYVLYCDSNIALAERGRASGYGEAVALRPSEVRAIRAREERVYRGAAAIFTISEYLGRSFQQDFGIPPERVHPIHAGPNFELHRMPDRPGAAAGAPPSVLFVGRHFERKGGDLLLRAFERVRRRVPRAELVIVGPPDLRVDQPGVRSIGFLDKDTAEGSAALQRLFTDARVFCLPTRFEPFGIAYLEAMAFGLPCVGTAVWAVPEIIADGETGFVVPVEDAEALADRLVVLLTDGERAARMGREGRRRLETRFTWPAVVGRMVCAMEPLLGRS